MTQPGATSIPWKRFARVPRWLWLSLALLFAIRAVLPTALERAIPWFARREAGADVEIENIDLALFSGEFIVRGLRVASPAIAVDAAVARPSTRPQAPAARDPEASDTAPVESGPALLSIALLRIEIDWLALLRAQVSLPLIQLDDLTLRLHQNRDGSFALPAPPASKNAEDSVATALPGESEGIAVADRSPAQGESNEQAPESVGSEGVTDTSGGWQLSVGRFELNDPDFAVHSERAGGEVARLRLARFAVDALTSGPAGFGLGDIALDEPEVFVERDWLFDPGFAGSSEAAPAGEPETQSLQIARLAISSGHFQIRSPDGPIESAIRIEVLQFDTTPGRTFPIELALDVGEGGVRLKGQFGIFPLAFEGEVAWHGLRVPPYLSLTTPAVVPWLASCNAEGRLDLDFRSQEPAGLVLRGEAQLSDLALRHPETGELALEVQRISMQLREAAFPLEAGRPQRMDIASLEIAQPKVVFTNPPDALDDLLAIFRAPPLSEDATGEEPATDDLAVAAENPDALPPLEADAGPAMAIEIEKLKLSDGELVFVDRSVTPRHETRIRDFRLDAVGVTSSPEGAEQVDIAGMIQQKGTFEIKGKLPRGKGSLRVEVRRLDLASYSGFARGAGLNLESGDASLASVIRIRDGRYQADNDLVLHDLRVDATDPGAFASTFGVSLDLALALLRGPRGDIELALPVSFDQRGVGVGLGTLIRSALKEALSGVLTSPFKLVGGLLPSGAKPAADDAIVFEAGEIGLNSRAEKRIQPLIDLLADRPGLGLTIRGQTAAADEPSLAYALLRDRAVAGDGLPEFEGAGFFARRRLTSALRERAEGGSGVLEPADEALLSRYVEAQDVPVERHEALALARAQSVVDALTAAGAPTGALAIGPPQTAKTPGVVIELGLRARAKDAFSE